MIEILILYAIIAVTFTFGKMLLAFLPPIFLIGLRMVIAGIIILSIQYFFKNKISIAKKDIISLMVLSFLHVFITYTTESMALQEVTPSCAALVFNLFPCFTALFSYIFFKELMTLKKWIGFAITLIGVGYMMPTDSSLCFSSINGAFFLLLISVISCALGWILFKKMLQRGYSALQLNGLAMMLGGIESFVVSYFCEPSPSTDWYFNIYFWALLFGIILLGNVIFYNMYGYLLTKYSATFLAFTGFITPLFTALYDYLFLGINVGTEFYIATMIVSYGIYIFYQEELRQGYIHK